MEIQFKHRKIKSKHIKKRKKPSAYKKLSILALVLTAAIVFLLSPKVYVVKGLSMQPTLTEGDSLYFSKYQSPTYGDLVVFYADNEEYGLIVKRVIGMEGDIISVNPDGTVIRNGELLEESYAQLDELGNSAMDEITVEKGMLFVLGDNRSESIDSRDVRIGQISITSVKGTVTSSKRTYE